jgi:ADP-ribosyl-[dinitrogen reductase] hydrolase
MLDRSHIEGALYGLLLGDAVGVPYEFHAPAGLPPLDAIDIDPPAAFHRSHRSVPPGTWSDDGAHALCLLASLLGRERLDPDDLGQRLLRWYESGYMAVGGVVFDVGIQTATALRAIKAGKPALDAGPAGEQDNGNGSLMRVLPLALWHRGDDRSLVRDARQQSRITHGHARAQLCCALYCLWARCTVEGAAVPWSDATHRLRAAIADEPALIEELDWSIRPDEPPSGTGSSYVVDCLRSARLAVAAGPYADVVRAAIALGRDTDTTAAVAGGIAGLRDGVEAIPPRWLARLRGRELAQPLVDALCTHLGA